MLNELQPIVDEYKNLASGCNNINVQEQAITVPAKTRLTLELNTYCLSPHSAAPSDDEPYILVSEAPDIPLYVEMMKYTNNHIRVSQTMKQSIIWNLKNGVKFENLPLEQKVLLLKIDSAAYLKVNNEIKEQLKNSMNHLFTQYIPSDILSSINLVKGKEYKYDTYRRNIENLKSKIAKPSNGYIKSDGYDIFAMVNPAGFSHAVVTFINTSNVDQTIHSYFKPLRKDIQPLGYDVPDLNEFRDALKQAFGELAVDVAALLGFKLVSGDRLTIENNPEKLIDLLKAFKDKQNAENRTFKEFGYNGRNDISDAFRHAYWNAIMARDIGDSFAADIANNHELNERNKEENQMDLWNNHVGREIGTRLKQKGTFDDDSYAKEILANKNKLRILR